MSAPTVSSFSPLSYYVENCSGFYSKTVSKNCDWRRLGVTKFKKNKLDISKPDIFQCPFKAIFFYHQPTAHIGNVHVLLKKRLQKRTPIPLKIVTAFYLCCTGWWNHIRHTHILLSPQPNTHTFIPTYTHARTHTHTRARPHVRAHTHTCTRTRAHAHTNTHACLFSLFFVWCWWLFCVVFVVVFAFLTVKSGKKFGWILFQPFPVLWRLAGLMLTRDHILAVHACSRETTF